MTNSLFADARNWRVAITAAVFAWTSLVGIFVGSAYAAPIFILAGVLFVCGAIRGQWPAIDRPLLSLAILLVAMCWASTVWSIAPQRTLHGALQITGVFAASLILLGEAKTLSAGSGVIFAAAMAGASIGAALGAIDFLTGFPIMGHVLTPDSPVYAKGAKMDRGLSYLVFILWPILAFAWRSRWRLWSIGFAAVCCAVVAVCYGITVQLSLGAGIAAFAVALIAPRLVAVALSILVAIVAIATPILALDFGARLLPLAGQIRSSAVHRLEIWDYMSRRALERPLSGWGWWSSLELPIHPDELAKYRYVTPMGTSHPHGNWMQLWVETGVVGAAIGLAFALLVIWRAWRLPKAYQPFALASCASVFIVSLASFDLATDSWWAALSATALLFTIAPKSVSPRVA